MIHDGDESSKVEKADDSELARNFKTLDEGMGLWNGMEWNDDCSELGGILGIMVGGFSKIKPNLEWVWRAQQVGLFKKIGGCI